MEGTANVNYEDYILPIHIYSDGDKIIMIDVMLTTDTVILEENSLAVFLHQELNAVCTVQLRSVETLVHHNHQLFKYSSHIDTFLDLKHLVYASVETKAFLSIEGNLNQEDIRVAFLQYIDDHCFIED
jgi:hypothetical protein